jgi:hypothetical protein
VCLLTAVRQGVSMQRLSQNAFDLLLGTAAPADAPARAAPLLVPVDGGAPGLMLPVFYVRLTG